MIVKNIDFSVNQQTIKFSTAAQLVANSAGIATATFSFSTDWSEYDTIKVIFSNGETKKSKILTTGQYTVTIPSECMTAGRIAVSAVGLKGAEGEETFKRATTERNNGVEVIPSGAFVGDPAGSPTPTEAEEILIIAQNANTTAEQANTTANTANLNANAALENSEYALSTVDAANDKAQEALDKFPYVIMGETTYGGTIADSLDTIIKNGYYTCYGSATGSPGATTSWFVTHHNSNVGTVTATQYASSFVDVLVAYKRNKIGSVWQPWKRFPDTRYKGLRLARRTILTSTAATIEFNTDSDGVALNSTLGGELLFYSGANSSITGATACKLVLNGITTIDYWDSGGTSSAFYMGYCGVMYSEILTKINICNQNIILNSEHTLKNASGGTRGSSGGGISISQSGITSIKLFISAGTFPAGTVVEWWERG